MDIVEQSYHAASRGVAWLCETSYKLARYAVPGRGSELRISVATPLYLLGVRYEAETVEACEEVLELVLSDARSRIWLTYRSGFEYIEGTHFSSDAGWGCMMRSGQMILAQALLVLTFGRDWRSSVIMANDQQPITSGESGSSDKAATEQPSGNADEAALLSLFADSASAPFSIHKIVLEGASRGHVAGSWLGPASISQVLAVLVNQRHAQVASRAEQVDPASSSAEEPALAQLKLHVAMDAILYPQNVIELATAGGSSWVPVMLLLPLRLGLDSLNAEFAPSLQAVMQLPQSLGIIGGRPRRSHYFVGSQADELLFLDPHEVQPALSASAPILSSCHCSHPLHTTPLLEIDPSLAIGFLCTSRLELDDLCERCEEAFARAQPLFSIATGSQPDWAGAPYAVDSADDELEGEENDMVRVQGTH